ncbi:MAG: GMC family oxidoreductase [Actinobacteria bacterium]|nr:GMC family oxidoreductase [Actinomycetota bacterium]
MLPGRQRRPQGSATYPAAPPTEVTVSEHDPTRERDHGYDVIVVGSGFGGSVSALRLTEKGYRVGVMEAGRRFDADTLPTTSWDVRNFLWAPKLGLKGIQRVSLLKDVMVVSGAGVGGGSLVYANTLYEPLQPFYDDPQWAHITDWRSELAPHYDQAKRMLGVTETPFETEADRVIKDVADEMGFGETYHPTPVGVYFGVPGQRVPDPYFGGEGPDRVGCIRCGECMTGCRHGAKNDLTANYLYLAEKLGAVVHPEHEVRDVRPRAEGGYLVVTQPPGASGRRGRREWYAEQVVLAASALGTQKLLHRLKAEGSLPAISDRLGALSRTNSEAILGAQARTAKTDYSRGIAITSSVHPDENTHIEPVRYGRGSNVMGMLATLMVDGGGNVPRFLRFLLEILRHPIVFLRSLSVRRWSERTIIVLVMQSLDNSLQVFRKRGLFGWKLSTRQGHGAPNPRWIPVGNEFTRRVADRIDGYPGGSWAEAVLNVPTTAHFIGGAPIGDSPASGVIDPYHRVYGCPGLHICDGAAITANLGVNPSLTITAMTERAMALWPNRGEEDPRPPLGQPYRRVAPVPPRQPSVPEHAPAALRLPLVS